MADPKNYYLNKEAINGKFVMIATPLPEILDPISLKNSQQYFDSMRLLQEEMAKMGWVEGGVPLSESRTSIDIHVDTLVDYALQDGQPTLFLAAVGYKTNKGLFVNREYH